MIQLIIGEKGKGKTKILLDKANREIRSVNGDAVYLDKNKQHMFELNNRIRLIDVSPYPIHNADAFVGFLYGLVSMNNDLEQVYLDSFLKIAGIEETDITSVLDKISALSDAYGVNFVISASVTEDQLPEKYREAVINE